ncbi:proton/sodium-glutamate symport protein [Fictibacillus macauensis ZFHKF-1]|uniref:Proton/sodium-glutamate symport protein n=1 Tax=Fictibacillus macauensis ZFHKF-1 TaxID=1196324 RepID=I8UJI8_9BACL|nr:dicarboxylate/amino acid:cation symporter [Fictibacillus macauensis]EIT86968.1 proton/sodium-glutamate symport protein [Fictibacillus macauensis ZFHKF-1]
MRKILKTYRFPILLLLAIVIGSIIGFSFGKKALVLKPFGDVFLNAMFMIVVPLVFFSISSAIASMGGAKRFGKVMGSMLSVFLFTGVIASVVTIAAAKLYSPSEGVSIHLTKPADGGEKTSIGDQIVHTLTVSDFSELFSRNNMLALILFSVLLGLAVSMIGEKGKPFAAFLKSGSEVTLKMVTLVMYYAPIGLGAYFAALIAQYGPQLLGSYVRAVLFYYPLAIVYFFGFFTLYAFLASGKIGIRQFWGNMLSPSLTALGTCSSAAAIPVNLEASKRMGVPDDIRETSIPLGATLHKDGSVMGGVLKITFLFGVFGHSFSGIGTYLLVIVVSLLVGMVMGAIPQGGMIGEMLILSLFGFPVEALPIAAAISTIIDPPATLINATGDNVASMLTARLVEGKDKMIESVTKLRTQKGA